MGFDMETTAIEELPVDSSIDIEENEVAQIIQSVKEAEYFDADSMAPLTPASFVSSSLTYILRS